MCTGIAPEPIGAAGHGREDVIGVHWCPGSSACRSIFGSTATTSDAQPPALQAGIQTALRKELSVIVFDRSVIDGHIFLSPRKHAPFRCRSNTITEALFLTRVCMSCLEGCGEHPMSWLSNQMNGKPDPGTCTPMTFRGHALLRRSLRMMPVHIRSFGPSELWNTFPIISRAAGAPCKHVETTCQAALHDFCATELKGRGHRLAQHTTTTTTHL